MRERNAAWLYGDDIGGFGADPVTLTVRGVTEETLPEEAGRPATVRPALLFRYRRQRRRPAEKRLVLNQTNLRRIMNELGADTDAWIGRRVVLWVEDTGTRFGPGIRVRAA